MKTLFSIVKSGLFILLLCFTFSVINAQDSTAKKPTKEDIIKNAVESRQYVFVAQTALPMGGRSINLTTIYDFTVFNDSLKSDLPYFGRSFSGQIDPSKGGINFTSTDFNYKSEGRKKGGWEITITLRNNPDWREFFLTIFTNGSASLQASSNNRQPISFNGYVEPRKVKK